jgi:hypothetical protein
MVATAVTEFDTAVEIMTASLRAVQQENLRLREQTNRLWQVEQEAREAQRQLRECQTKLAKALADVEQHRSNSLYWQKAVRYEQRLKKPTAKPRHIPLYNSVRRTKFESPPWVNREREFLREWRRENNQMTSRGRSALASILSENSNEHAADLTQRDATVAATVIQWLGTNCGQSFLYEVDRRIKARKAALVPPKQ